MSFLFARQGRQSAIVYACAVAAGYVCAALLLPDFAPSAGERVYARETFIILCIASLGLSVWLFAVRRVAQAFVALALRCFVLMLLGYSSGGFAGWKLILIAGLMAETGFLIPWPWVFAMSGAEIAALSAAQFPLPFLGENLLVEHTLTPRPDEFAALVFSSAAVAIFTALIQRHTDKVRSLETAMRRQEDSLRTLSEFNLSLQRYARTVDEESAERERNRISRELHDISGYIFTNLIALMDAAGSIALRDKIKLTETLLAARKQAQEGLRETRLALRKMREVRSPGEEGIKAIVKIVGIFRSITGIEVELSLGNLPNDFGPSVNLTLYRLVQEALTNAIRHGRATKVSIRFWVHEQGLILNIVDDGEGAAQVVKGIGLTGMEERVGGLGGTVQAGNAPEGGFSLTIRIPLNFVSNPEMPV